VLGVGEAARADLRGGDVHHQPAADESSQFGVVINIQ
jgi:hypothetical protein